MFKSGMNNVLMRLSETGMLQEESKGLMPSVAFKVLRDGKHSDNIVAMPSFLGSESWNFFGEQMDTRVDHFVKDTCPQQTIRKKLGQGNRFVFSTGSSDLALHNEDGTEAVDKFDFTARHLPYKMGFAANEPFKSMFNKDKEIGSDGKQVSWLDQLQRIKKGDALFTVKALTAPEGIDGSKWVDIGTITLETDLTTSTFGDTRLFFNHQRKDEDLPFYPLEWVGVDDKADRPRCYQNKKHKWHWGVPDPNKPDEAQYAWPQTEEEAKKKYIEQGQTQGCPFSWLWDWSKLRPELMA